MARGMGFSTILISPEEIKILDSSDIIIDISPRSTEYIPGAISIPYDRFIDPAGRLEPIGEMTRILGEAGVSENDSIIIYMISFAAASPR
jgi:thiosulfate/3-mercaptopyruvate sulfurtransferase